ncbi:aldo/keto reductase [Paraburkholderia sp. RL18-103-BIB-C]|jgi:D-threo-aldose 1-dehydrogenase|uniref:aldo/keto reductase n=1 Tax=unclassified Paraburkholderia TaxID=2615204 RepID=UPI0038B96CC5
MATDSTPLPRRRVGATGLDVTVLGFGAAPLGNLFSHLDEATSVATVVEAFDNGINLFDMAPHYGNGLAELRVGAALRQVLQRQSREDVVVSTKVGRWFDPMAPRPAIRSESEPVVESPGFAGPLPHRAMLDYSYDGTLRSIEQSLLRTGLDRFDIVLIHDVDVWTHGAAVIEARFKEAMDGAYRALSRLRDEGVVRAIGVGLNESEMCERFARAGVFDTMLLAGRYSLLEQPALTSFLPLAQAKNIAVLLGGVFNSGILATGAVPGARYNYQPAPPDVMTRVAKIETVCDSHGVRLADAAMQFALGHPAVTSLVLGAVTPEEVRRNVASLASPIPDAMWRDLRTEGLLPDAAPTPRGIA